MDNNQINNYDNNGSRNDGGRGSGGGNGNNGSGKGPNKQSLLIMLVAALLSLLCISYFTSAVTSATKREITYTEFLQMVENKQIQSVRIESNQLVITPKVKESSDRFLYYYQPTITYITGKIEDDDTLTQRLIDADVEVAGTVPDGSGIIMSLLYYIVPILLMWGLLSLLLRKMTGGGGAFSMGKSNAKVYVQKETGITFRDVAGEDEAKESLQEVVDFLHNPGKYSKIGARLPKGALLVGPPGTGKTMLAKAVAGEAHVPFFSLAGSDFIELYVGVGASRVRDLFREAEKNAPCIIFIDEIDAIGRSRDSKYGGGNEEREQTLNQLLSEMDGFDGKKGIIILAATNRPEILDKALLRPGRFDRRIIVDKPDLKGRVNILKVHAKDVLMDETVDLDAIALATSGAVGADLANMINEAAINAVKEGREFVSQKDLFNAVEVVLVGKEKKDRIMSKEERRIVSYHEVGHALISALQKNSEPVQKITIVPRTMGALGYVMHVPEDEKYLNSKAELHDMVVGLLGGRAAEEIVFDTVTTGASNDIEKATNIARSMVTRYGMSQKFGLIGLETVESQYLDGRSALNCADNTAAEIDAEVMRMLKEAYEEALGLLRENREIMDLIAAHLIEKETITGKEFMKIFREAKGLPEPSEKEEAEEKPSDEKASEKQEGVEEKASNEKASEKQESVEEKAANEKPSDEKASEKQEEAEEKDSGEKASEKQEGVGEKPSDEKASESQEGVEEKAANEKASNEKASEKQESVEEKAANEKPSDEKASEKQEEAEEKASDEKAVDEKASEKQEDAEGKPSDEKASEKREDAGEAANPPQAGEAQDEESHDDEPPRDVSQFGAVWEKNVKGRY